MFLELKVCGYTNVRIQLHVSPFLGASRTWMTRLPPTTGSDVERRCELQYNEVQQACLWLAGYREA